MKVDKRVVLSSAVVLGVAALIAGSTIAYFTDKDEETNSFTVGDVKIELFESQLHRMNSGRQGSFDAMSSDPDYCTYTGTDIDSNTGAGPQPYNPITGKGGYESARYCTPHMNANEGDASTITAVANGHTRTSNPARTWGYKDETIEADAETYKTGYFARVAQNIVPGQWVRKFSYVKNASTSSDAYVLIRYLVPASYANNIDVKIPGTPYEEDSNLELDGHQGYFTAVTKGTNGYVAFDASTADAMDNYAPYDETIDNVAYKVYAAVTTDVLKPGEMTYWSPVNTIRLKTTTSNTDPQDANYVAPQDQINIKVDAQAIQAKTFTDAIDAINHLQ